MAVKHLIKNGCSVAKFKRHTKEYLDVRVAVALRSTPGIAPWSSTF